VDLTRSGFGIREMLQAAEAGCEAEGLRREGKGLSGPYPERSRGVTGSCKVEGRLNQIDPDGGEPARLGLAEEEALAAPDIEHP